MLPTCQAAPAATFLSFFVDWFGSFNSIVLLIGSVPLTQSMEVVTTQYRKLAPPLNPAALFPFRSLESLQTQMLPPLPKGTQPQVAQPLSVVRSSSGDGYATLQGGQFSLNTNLPESTRPTLCVALDQLVSNTLILPWINRLGPIPMSQMDQSGNATSSQFDQTESTRMGQINQATPPSTEHSETDTTDVTWKTDSTRPSKPPDSESLTFWTACPYCYVLYEYPKVYEDCTLRCQAENCRRAFHAVVIPSPPPVDGKETYLCTMGFFPLGFSGNGENMGGNFPRWSPVSTMFACPNNKNAEGEEEEESQRGRICGEKR
uniref:Uncharacterized protein n=2 Tax=Gossypium raimondii TaxID=29730 RepID=A0A0D2SYK2_GOSRA|nr:hypothetical protein B456_008G017100 [Gossypium raimondii]